MTPQSIPSRELADEALREAVKLALLAAGNAESLCIPLGDGRFVAVGTVQAIQRLLPDPFTDFESAHDEVRPPPGN